MVYSDPSLEVHSLDITDTLQDLDMTDSSLEDEKLHHNVIDHEP